MKPATNHFVDKQKYECVLDYIESMLDIILENIDNIGISYFALHICKDLFDTPDDVQDEKVTAILAKLARFEESETISMKSVCVSPVFHHQINTLKPDYDGNMICDVSNGEILVDVYNAIPVTTTNTQNPN